ncbi:hypothetical protein LTR66_008549 [Elasticomyces elasticus]|nr:hypothetical protein LTR66_008549 [Elasticomyces elasticus]
MAVPLSSRSPSPTPSQPERWKQWSAPHSLQVAQWQQREKTLTFYQRHFKRPTPSTRDNPYEAQKPSNRHFSFLSVGFLLAAGAVVLALSIILASVLATVLNRRGRQQDSSLRPSPIRIAVLANFPDPAIYRYNDTWYAFATNNAAGILRQPENHTAYQYGLSNVQLATSSDLVNWTLHNAGSDPLPKAGAWAAQNLTRATPHIPRADVWAPDILHRPSDGRFVLYYSAMLPKRKGRVHCIGAAVSNNITGPFIPLNDSIACPIDQGGAIDPAGFIDEDGSVYLAWKVDGNNIGNGGSCGNTVKPIIPTPIMLQRMHPNGTTAMADPIQIFDRSDSDGPLVEAPALIRSHEGIYFLFFSSGCTRAPTYTLKYATATNVSGPYTRAQDPLLKTGDWGLVAPGSVGVRDNGDGTWEMALHSRTETEFGGVRAMYTSKLLLNGTVARLTR